MGSCRGALSLELIGGPCQRPGEVPDMQGVKEHFKTLNKSLGKGCAVGAIAVPLQGKRGSPGFGDLSGTTGHLPA